MSLHSLCPQSRPRERLTFLAVVRLLLPGQRVFFAHGTLPHTLAKSQASNSDLSPCRTTQLIASSFILNNCTSPRLFPLHPYLHSFSNIRSRDDLLEPCWIPDVDPSEIAAARGDFSFAAGDFLELYGDSPGASIPLKAVSRHSLPGIGRV